MKEFNYMHVLQFDFAV